MGQKTHPLVFRLGIVQEHQSDWYANFKFRQYANCLEEDDKIRTYINTIARKNLISEVQIHRNTNKNKVKLIITTGTPDLLVGESGDQYKQLSKDIKKLLLSRPELTIKFSEILKFGTKNNKDAALFTHNDATVLAHNIAKELENRAEFRPVIRTAKTEFAQFGYGGIKIQISGRLNGAEIARSEWTRNGRVPLQTLRASIDYATVEANTIYGVLGIKIWIFKGEFVYK